MDTLSRYLTPENITLATGIAGGLVVLGLMGLVIVNRKTLSKGIGSIFSQGGLFYFGMGLFMMASVVEAGPVLNRIAMHGALWGYGGHVLVFAFDMIAAVSLRARLNARRVFDAHGMKVQMWGIWLSALVSIVANFAGAWQSFNPSDFSHLWMFAWLLPLIGAIFPSMIIVLSLAADHIIDTTAINNKVDLEEFKTSEKKRIDILKVRIATEHELLEEEAKIAALRRKKNEASGQIKREWRFMRWMRPEASNSPSIEALQAEIEAAVKEARTPLEQQITTLTTALAEAQQLLHSVGGQISELAASQQTLTQQMGDLAASQQAMTEQVEGQHRQLQSATSLKDQLRSVASTVEKMKLNNSNGSASTSQNEASISASASEIEASNGRASTIRPAKKMKDLKGQNEASVSANEASTSSEALQHTDEMKLSNKEKAFLFIANYQRQHEGAEPQLEDIMAAVPCSQGSASNYRALYREQSSPVGLSNGHHVDQGAEQELQANLDRSAVN